MSDSFYLIWLDQYQMYSQYEEKTNIYVAPLGKHMLKVAFLKKCDTLYPDCISDQMT
jgi:hypothetical protein